jgi:putative membrane protein
MLHQEITSKVLASFFKVYNNLGYGFPEKVCENAPYYEYIRNNVILVPNFSFMKIVLRLLIYTGAVLLTAWLLPGVTIEKFTTALMVAIALAILNTFLRPILILLTIPVTILTLGLFLLVINALIILLIARFVPGFTVDGFWWALLFSVILSIIAAIFGTSSTTIVRKDHHEKQNPHY